MLYFYILQLKLLVMKRLILVLATALFTLSSYSCRQEAGGTSNPSQQDDPRNTTTQDTSEVGDPMEEVREESGGTSTGM